MKKYLMAIMVLCISSLLTLSVSATLTPSTFTTTLTPTKSTKEDKTVFLPGIIPKGDVVFAFDLTGSMSDAIDVAKAQAINMMGNISLLISDAQFGVVSFMDYPHNYDSYGYAAWYGYPGGEGIPADYAYAMNQSITSDKTAVSNVINGLRLGYGEDMPQDYARIIFESYSDASIGWRTGAKHILIILGDSVPHYENLNEGMETIGNASLPYWPGNYSTGGDPGRDEVMGTADDIYLPAALQAMATNEITLLYVKCHDGAWPNDIANMMYWTYWTGITGGYAYGISDASLIPDAIAAMVKAMATHIHKLTLKAEAGWEAWLTSVVPPEYDEFDVPSGGVTKTFTITLTVPLGTTPGTYVFHIIADADGADYGEQLVTIRVPFVPVIPEIPFGTIAASAAMILAFAVYLGIKPNGIFRRRH
jgi:hypothetical protein